MIDLRLAELRERYDYATMRTLIALKLRADYRIARLGSVRFLSHSAARIAGT